MPAEPQLVPTPPELHDELGRRAWRWRHLRGAAPQFMSYPSPVGEAVRALDMVRVASGPDGGFELIPGITQGGWSLFVASIAQGDSWSSALAKLLHFDVEARETQVDPGSSQTLTDRLKAQQRIEAFAKDLLSKIEAPFGKVELEPGAPALVWGVPMACVGFFTDDEPGGVNNPMTKCGRDGWGENRYRFARRFAGLSERDSEVLAQQQRPSSSSSSSMVSSSMLPRVPASRPAVVVDYGLPAPTPVDYGLGPVGDDSRPSSRSDGRRARVGDVKSPTTSDIGLGLLAVGLFGVALVMRRA